MLSKPAEVRKLPPILPRPHVSPFKHISPILKKYNQQRRVVTILPFNSSSPHKNITPKKLPLKPKPSDSSPTAEMDCTDGNDPLVIEPISCTTVDMSQEENINLDPSSEAKDNQCQALSSLEISVHAVEEPCSSATATRQKSSTLKAEGSDEVDEEVAEDEQDQTAAVVVVSNPIHKKQSVSKKKNRIQRDMEASLALLQPKLMANDPKKEEREALFANSYLLRATEILKGNPEVYEKFLMTLCKHHQCTRSPVELYSEIKVILKDYPALVRDFIVFLRPEQAKECGMYQEHIALSKVREFFRKVEMHFKNQPQHISRILRTFSQLQQQVDITSGEVLSALQPLLRNQSHLMEELHHLLPDAAPPEYLMTDFEVVNLPNSDDDNSSIDSCEEVIIPDTPDPYGGKDCPCDCHSSSTDNRLLNKSRHCIKCGVKFIDGRIYIQTGKVLKPAQVTYHDHPPGTSEKEKGNPPHIVPSKSQTASDANSKSLETTSKNDAAKKDNPRNAPPDPTPPIITHLPSGSKLPFDVIEDTVFPVVADPANKSTPSDFSHLRDMIGPKNNVNQAGLDPKAGGSQNVKWSRDEDTLIIYNCQRYGITKKAFCSTAEAVGTRTAEEVEGRSLKLIQCISKELKKQGYKV